MVVHTPVASEDPSVLGSLGTHVESFLRHLRTLGYAKRTLRKKRPVVVSFARWTRRKQVAVEDLTESHVMDFVERARRPRSGRATFELGALRSFLGYLRSQGAVPTSPCEINCWAGGELKRHYEDYLRNERGLSERSIDVYLPLINDLLTELVAKTGSAAAESFSPKAIGDFLLDHVRDGRSETSRLLATAVRSFLRFLYFRGETSTDLSGCVPTVRRWRDSVVPHYLSPEEVEHVLSTANQSTLRGRRDHAILLLLARLGLRAGEVVALELRDIRWQAGEIVVHGKSRVLDRLPLLADVGEALALYLRDGRVASGSRRVFLRAVAPRIGLSGPASIGHVVRLALSRADLHPKCRRAAHLFRHSLATTMIRQGASIAQIAQVLRHRDHRTTQIYAKVDFEALRGVARPWPSTGGAP